MILPFILLLGGSDSSGGGPATLSVPVTFKSIPIPVRIYPFNYKSMSLDTIYPANDWACKVKLKDISVIDGSIGPLTTGIVRAFLSTSAGPTATPADSTFDIHATHLGNGIWLILFDAAVLTATLMQSLFGSTPPYLIVEYGGGFRVSTPLVYATTRPPVLG